ncbi:MAG: GWxTD domain-containing protein [Bacteroidales bacterium]|nr:GWxTD domain-containing protein [Bacteroidales bacterium]
MKRIVLTVLTTLVCLSAQAQMQAMFGYSTYCLIDKHQPYIETYLQFDAWTMHFEEVTPGSYRASAEVTLVLRQQDSVCYAKKYELGSPTVSNLENLDFSFLDVQRFSVGNGIYNLDITLRDKGVDAPAASLTEKIIVNYGRTQPMLSSLQLLASVKPTVKENILSRGGYDMEPYVSDFVPEQIKQLNYYYEIYQLDNSFPREAVLTVAYIEVLETGRRATLEQVARRSVETMMPVLGSIDISNLPSGNYNLVCEVRNRDNQPLLYTKMPFQRSNPGMKESQKDEHAISFASRITDESMLDLYLDALYPLASETEKSVVADLVRRPALEEKQAFFYNFWKQRNALAPEAEWLKYKDRIDYVQEHFSYPLTRGIMTDRGRVYLTYGPPDYVRDEKNFCIMGHSTSMENRTTTLSDIGNNLGDTDGAGIGQVFYLPYQLWRYNRLSGDDQNRVFIFWDEHRSGNYTLLHSNARGEVQEADWERRLSRQQIPEGTIGEVGRQFNRGY